MNILHSDPISINNDSSSRRLLNVTDRTLSERTRHDTITRLKSLHEPRSRRNSLSPGLASPTPPTFIPDGSHEVSLVGKYLLVEHVEGHNSGNVYRAVDYNTEEEFICKVFDCNDYRKTVDSYFRVAPHPNINNVVDVVVTTTKAYIFFNPGVPMQQNSSNENAELNDTPKDKGFRAENLHSFVRSKRKLAENVAAPLFAQAVAAVAHCHSKNIVLRDLKLRKFIFKDNDRTQLMLESLDDACVLDSNDDRMFDKHGCPAYASPEILCSAAVMGSSNVSRSEPGSSLCKNGYSGKASDVWSLGVMLYTMLVGHYPFHESDPMSMFAKISRGQYSFPDSLSSESRDLVRNLLRRHPSERLTARCVLDHPWLKKGGECWDMPRSCVILGAGGDRRIVDRSYLNQFGRHSGGHSLPASLYYTPYYEDQMVPDTVPSDPNDPSDELVFSFGE